MNGIVLGIVAVLGASPAAALGPANVFVLVNKNVAESQEVADHYCSRRGVPKKNVVVLDLPGGEDISRADYDAKMVKPLREALAERRDEVKVLLSTYGVPLRVGGQPPSEADKKVLAEIQPQVADYQRTVAVGADLLACREHQAREAPALVPAAAIKDLRERLEADRRSLQQLENRRRYHSWAESQACVDSELSLLWWDEYELRRFLPNLLNWQVSDKLRKERPAMVMTARLDGPTVAIAKGLVDQAIEVEQKGLNGKVYVDARKIGYDPKADPGYGYGGYDESLREMACLLSCEAGLDVVLDDEPALFQPGTCPDCALYCGWYSLANYIPSNKFVPGAVAYHVASSEAVSLRNAKTKLWCKSMLEDGVAATLGPVAEPYTIGFPKPAEFFGFLVTGDYPLVECYHRTALLTSWMTVLVGDPLYNPFAKSRKLEVEQVKPSPLKGQFFLRTP